MIGVAVARTGPPRLDVTQNGTRIAADCVVSHARPLSLLPPESLPVPGQEWPESFSIECRSHHAAHSEWPERSESPPVPQCPWPQTAQSARDLRSESIPLEAHRPLKESDNREDSRSCQE